VPLKPSNYVPSCGLQVKSESTSHHTGDSDGLSDDRHGGASGRSRGGGSRAAGSAGGGSAGGETSLGRGTSGGASGGSSSGGEAGGCNRVISDVLASGDAGGRYSSMGSSGNAWGRSTGSGSLGGGGSSRGRSGGRTTGGTGGRRRRNSGRCTSSSGGALSGLGYVELLGLSEDSGVALGGGQKVDLEVVAVLRVVLVSRACKDTESHGG